VSSGVLVDTNVLLAYSRNDHPRHAAAQAGIDRLVRQGDVLFVASQNIAEFWSVMTRPAGSPNGLGYLPSEARTAVDRLLEVFELLPDTDSAFAIWLDLVTRYNVSGKTTHDARLVAAMLANDVSRILTFNGSDFERYKEISIETP